MLPKERAKDRFRSLFRARRARESGYVAHDVIATEIAIPSTESRRKALAVTFPKPTAAGVRDLPVATGRADRDLFQVLRALANGSVKQSGSAPSIGEPPSIG